MDRRALGRWGEELAVQHLRQQGFEVLDRNWRRREGELDVVAVDGRSLVFVEVKARSGLAFGEPAEAVSRTKARRIHGLARQWLSEHRPPGEWELRFDVVSVLRTTGLPEVSHLRGAF
ncbi:MAG TPA: YraN family protein [Mycobacteriales bacterium]|nr:YraN family protein [Mycobacteriales bacterium]